MSMQRSIFLPLAGTIALALCGTLAVASAQTQVPSAPPAMQQGQSQTTRQDSGRFYPGTESSATYPLADGTLTVNAGMPDHVRNYGPPPAFKTLDSKHNGRIGESEARAYPPLDNDFLYASGGGKSISRGQYEKWAKGQY
jgi:hypothetical protein